MSLSAEFRKAITVQAEPWLDQANCHGCDPDLFFPERGESTLDAKRVCWGCVVREECLQYALDHHEWWGVWGGLSGRERKRLFGETRRAATA